MLEKLKKLSFERILLILIFLIFFTALRWNHFSAPMERDEGVYAYSSWIMRDGINPYEYSFPYKPPMIIYTYLLGQVLLGDNVVAVRVIAFVFSLVTVILVGLIAKKEFGKKAFWVTIYLLSII